MNAENIFAKIDRAATFLILVIIPFLMLFVYYALIASDRYVSEATFTIKKNGVTTSGIDVGFLGLGGNSGLEDVRMMKEHLVSPDMLTFLDETINHKAHYQDSGADWFSALEANASRESYLRYYQNHIDVHLDEVSGLLFVEVQAFDPAYAQQLLKNMLAHAEDVVNEMSHHLAMAQYEFVEQQLLGSKNSLKEAKQQLLAFQNKHQVFSPEQQGQSLTGIMDVLASELSQERAKLKQTLGSQKKDSPQVVALQERIRALTDQIRDEKLRLVGDGGRPLNDLMAEFTNLQLNLEFSKDAYASILVALEQARAEVSKKMKYLVVVSKPSLGEEAKYPNKLYILITVLVVFLMLFGITRMTISTIREHQD